MPIDAARYAQQSDPLKNRHFFQRGTPRDAFFREPRIELPPLLPRRLSAEERALLALTRMTGGDRETRQVLRP